MTTDGLDRLNLLASAMAARPLEVVAGRPGEPTWTDGVTVHLDPDLGPSDHVRALAVQASLLAAGSLDPSIVERLVRSRGSTRRYLAVEGHRALAVNEPYLPGSVGPMIDRAVAASVDDPGASLDVAGRRSRGTDPPAIFGAIRPRRILAVLERSDLRGAHGGAAVDAEHVASLTPLDEEDDDGTDLGQLLTSPVGGGGPIGRLLRRLIGQGRSRSDGGPPGAEGATHFGRATVGRSRGVVVSGRVDTQNAGEVLSGRSETVYPEWNVHATRYRTDWCTVIEADPPPHDRGAISLPDASAFRRPLARLGTGLVRCRRQRDGDDIDIDAVVEARVEVAAGAPADEAQYVQSLPRRRDLSVLVLLDVSGSAAEPSTTGRPVHELQVAAATALTTALADLGDRVALYAFNSQGRSSVRIVRAKGFDDPIDGRFAARVGGLVPVAYTRLGAAIRHGARVVDERGGTSRRLLVVLSDGFAYDHGYEGRYGEADARKALSEARRRGVGCLCLSIGAGTDAAALARVFGTAAHAMVERVDQLPRLVGPLFRAALRTSEAQRRVQQRRERTRERLVLDRSAR